MQRLTRKARIPNAWQAGRDSGQAMGVVAQGHYTPKVLKMYKRGRDVFMGKLVVARPLNAIVLGTPFKDRQDVEHPSLPPAVVDYAIRDGATWWVVRKEHRGECFGILLADVPRVGWLKPSDGLAEFFVPLSRFQRIPWQDWCYVEEPVIVLGRPDRPAAQQLDLFGVTP